MVTFLNAAGKASTASADNPLPVTAGAADDPAWDGEEDTASVVALLKGIYERLVAIEANTAG